MPFDGNHPILMRMDVVATQKVMRTFRDTHPCLSGDEFDEVVMAHPTVLHHFRFTNGRRNKSTEILPSNASWKLDYKIGEEGDISLIDESLSSKTAKVGMLQKDSEGQYFFMLRKINEDDSQGGRGRG